MGNWRSTSPPPLLSFSFSLYIRFFPAISSLLLLFFFLHFFIFYFFCSSALSFRSTCSKRARLSVSGLIKFHRHARKAREKLQRNRLVAGGGGQMKTTPKIKRVREIEVFNSVYGRYIMEKLANKNLQRATRKVSFVEEWESGRGCQRETEKIRGYIRSGSRSDMF